MDKWIFCPLGTIVHVDAYSLGLLENFKKRIPVANFVFYNPLLFNTFKPNVFSHPYQLDESISNFRVVGWYFSFLFKFQKKLL